MLNDVFDSVGEKTGRENWSGLRGVTVGTQCSQLSAWCSLPQTPLWPWVFTGSHRSHLSVGSAERNPLTMLVSEEGSRAV